MGYELTKDLETGNATIDGEHRELFRAVNNLMDACKIGQGRSSINAAAQFLLQYVNSHFAHEEQLQQSSRYPNITAHKTFHEKYKKDLKAITDKIPATNVSVADLAVLNSSITILVNHIRAEDKALAAFLKSKA